MNDDPLRRLADLLQEPRETLSIEVKGWLDLTNNAAHKAALAKAIIALANHGGGHIIIGLTETADGVVEAEGRPESLSVYAPDSINAVVRRYLEPPFHCDVEHVPSPHTGNPHPIVVVPGGHRFPVRSRRAGPNGDVMRENVYYIRRAGPQSEQPQSGQEWDALIRRCITNGRDELVDQFRRLMAGGVAHAEVEEEPEYTVEDWAQQSFDRWQQLTSDLAGDHAARFPRGYYALGYKLISDELMPVDGAQLLDRLRRGTVRYTGWPQFWVPTREDIAPYVYDDSIECWIGRDRQDDAAHSDFWKVARDGRFFLIRGHQEDTMGDVGRPAGGGFDITLPTWRVGEALLHASNMAQQFDVPNARVAMIVEWTGLANRQLVTWGNPNRMLFGGHRAHQGVFRKDISFRANTVPDTLPELVNLIVRPLYELFSFFELPGALVTEELARMQQQRL